MPRVRQSPWFPRLGMKESHFFDKGCVLEPSRPRCDPALESYYIRSVLKLPDAAKAGFKLATFEATPTYVKHEFEHVSGRGRGGPRRGVSRSSRGATAHSGADRSTALVGAGGPEPCSLPAQGDPLAEAGHLHQARVQPPAQSRGLPEPSAAPAGLTAAPPLSGAGSQSATPSAGAGT